MNKYLQDLVALSKIDQEIDNFEPRMQAAAKESNAVAAKIEKLDASLQNYDEQVAELKLERVRNDENILKFGEKIKSIKTKLANAKSEKEINALKIENDIAKDYQEAAGLEIEKIDQILEAKEAEIKEAKAAKKELSSELKALEKTVKSELADIEKERENVYAKKEELLKNMNAKILTFYEKIRKWAKNTAVVPVRKQACYGCFMKIYDKTYLNILKGKEIITCPHCGRILYKEPDDC